MDGSVKSGVITRAEAEDFLYAEARLLDEGRFKDWLELFTEDGIYWLPIDREAGPTDHLSIIYDDDLRRRERVYRLTQTSFPAQDPPSSTHHLISNVMVEDATETDATILSSQLIHEIRAGAADDRQLDLGDQRAFAAHGEHRLRLVAGTWKIARKRLVLLNRDTAIPNLTFLL